MPDILELEVATPERLIVREQATEVQSSRQERLHGNFARARAASERARDWVPDLRCGWQEALHLAARRLCRVLPGNVRVLANTAERAEEIDIERARADLQRAETEVFNPALGVDPAVALDAMAWAQARLDATQQK